MTSPSGANATPTALSAGNSRPPWEMTVFVPVAGSMTLILAVPGSAARMSPNSRTTPAAAPVGTPVSITIIASRRERLLVVISFLAKCGFRPGEYPVRPDHGCARARSGGGGEQSGPHRFRRLPAHGPYDCTP